MILAVITAQMAGGQTNSLKWDFEGDPNEGIWTANGEVTELKSVGGLLVGNAVGDNAVITSPLIRFEPQFYDAIEMVRSSDKGGAGKITWTANLEDEDNGYLPNNTADFSVPTSFGRVVRVHPFWHTSKEIQQIRIHLPQGKFRIAIITVGHKREPLAPARRMQSWQFTGMVPYSRWGFLHGDIPLFATEAGLTFTSTPDLVLGSPSVRVSSDLNKYVIIKMMVSAGTTGTLGWVTNTRNGIRIHPFNLITDGKMHTYEIEVGKSEAWKDQIRMLTLKPSDAPQAEVVIESITIAPGVKTDNLQDTEKP